MQFFSALSQAYIHHAVADSSSALGYWTWWRNFWVKSTTRSKAGGPGWVFLMISSCFQSFWLNLCLFPQVGSWAQRVKFHTIHRLIPPSFLHTAWLWGLNWCKEGNLSFSKYLQDSSPSSPSNLLQQHSSAITALPNLSGVATVSPDDIRECHD